MKIFPWNIHSAYPAVLLGGIAIAVLTAAAAPVGGENRQAIPVLRGIPYPFAPREEIREQLAGADDSVTLVMDGITIYSGSSAFLLKNGLELKVEAAGEHILRILSGGREFTERIRSIHGFMVLLPPLVAIVFALIFKQVLVALLAGVWLGTLILTGYHPVSSVLRIVDYYLIETLAGKEEGTDRISIIVFTLLLGGMVGITSRMGGMQGIVNRISRLATNARRGQFTVWLMGVIIFFDDYTNTLIVGNTTRPLTDKLKISREKLSYIVDSTAAPITSLMVITSWIGFQISLIDQSFKSLGVDRNPLATFVSSLPYSAYPILAVLFVLFIVLSGRDYSYMLKAERRARITGKVSGDDAAPMSNLDANGTLPAPGTRPLFINGIFPIAVVICVTFLGLILTGRESLTAGGADSFGLLDMIKESNSFKALLWGSFSGCLVAALLALSQGLLTLTATMDAWVNGIKSMMSAILILILAWCIGKICTDLHTADYLVYHLSEIISPRFLPLMVFLLAMGISFSTGTSWGTMSILTPIVIPLVYGTSAAAGITGSALETVLLSSIAAILSGAVFGDHCSPISDTTIMSSMASGADHIDHVKTQLPYALTVGAVSLLCGYLLTALGLPVFVSLILAALLLLAVIRIFGRMVPGG
ncbi:MAG: Na+/H+ antiporter NhaC family protein [Candidatus Krumholzibacteriota bacterium]|nr:Na+/H+ antiporter NhaC family protein [Candidatus Krumholzibacteriota bacterium]